ncbi:MAG: ABC transporter permease [Acidobacteria bacterium]|nr:ABC transporter permease [Acidobacteriota bacterium]MCB9377290.1 ABC transporter permease [Holophagales bacterium]
MLGIAIGVASVVLLTSIGEGTRRYILGQFSQFGTNLIAINPGKTETAGIPGVFGGSTRPLTIDDAEELERIAGVEAVVPAAMGTARVEAPSTGLARRVAIYGVTPEIREVWRFEVAQGGFWPRGDPRRGAPVCVLGQTLARELFGERSPLGEFVRIAGARFRVIGLMEPKGTMLGIDIDDVAYIPVATAMDLFNLPELLEIDVLYAHSGLTATVEEAVKRTLTRRHGDEDFTVTTQEAMLEVFGNVMNVVTMAVGAIAGISLFVGAIGVLTMMWIAVGERTAEIGLVRAFGASKRQVRILFLAEAGALGLAGGAAGLAAGLGLVGALRLAVPGLPVATPVEYVIAALAVSLVTGLVSGVAPAARAATLDPIEALRAE